jgi:nuclear pore complex protein Nup107
MCEEKQTMEMNRLGANFWEAGLDAALSGAPEESLVTEEEEWENEVLVTLTSLRSIPVDEGYGFSQLRYILNLYSVSGDHPFHFCQLYLILNQTDTLLTLFADGLQSDTYPVSSPEYAPLCRFFAHLCLFLRLIDVSIPPLAEQVILEAYLQVLEAAGQRELIAMYAGALGDNAVERYALFLVSLELSLDSVERRDALTRAKDNGLDMDKVAIATAELTIEKAFEVSRRVVDYAEHLHS